MIYLNLTINKILIQIIFISVKLWTSDIQSLENNQNDKKEQGSYW